MEKDFIKYFEELKDKRHKNSSNYMSCNAETYTSLGGSNGCADQLTNWDGTKKLGLESVTKKKGRSY